MNLTEAYSQVYYTEDNLLEDLYNLFNDYDLFDSADETLEFAEELIAHELCGEFLGELANIMEVDITEHLVEGVIVERAAALRSVINALSQAGRIKAGLKAGTAMGKKAETVVKGAAASTSIRSARAARVPAPAAPKPGRPLAAQQLRKAADVSKATKALPAAGKTSAPKPVAAPKSTPAAKSPSGWERHNQAVSTAQQKVAQARTVAQAFMKAFTGAAKKAKGAAADPWKQFPGKRQVQRGLPKTGPSSTLPGRALPSSGMRGVSAVRGGQGSTAGVRSTTMKDPYPANLQKPAPKPKFGNQTDVGVPEKPTKYMQLTSPKSTSAPTPKATPAPRQAAPKANKMTSGADALNKARRALAGAGAAAVATGAAAPLVSGEKKSSEPTASQKATKAAQQKAETKKAMAGDSRDTFKRSSKELAGDFDKNFAAARKAGRQTFSWRGKEYTTKLRGEEVDNFDLVMDHLLSEGYAETHEDALTMMTALDEGAIVRLAKMAASLIKKPGASKLTKTALPPKMDPALKAVKDMVRKQYGGAAIMGSSEQKYAAARRAAQAPKKPAAKPADRYPGDVYSKDGLGGIRGYTSGD